MAAFRWLVIRPLGWLCLRVAEDMARRDAEVNHADELAYRAIHLQ